MKKYNVSLSNNSSIFDSRNNFETAEEAVAFACGRGSTYQVFIDAGGDEISDIIVATHYSKDSSFVIDDGWGGVTFYSVEQFTAYIKKHL